MFILLTKSANSFKLNYMICTHLNTGNITYKTNVSASTVRWDKNTTNIYTLIHAFSLASYSAFIIASQNILAAQMQRTVVKSLATMFSVGPN